MGCSGCREHPTSEEQRIVSSENTLGYFSVESETAINQIKRVSQYRQLTVEQLKLAHSYFLPATNFVDHIVPKLRRCQLEDKGAFKETTLVLLLVLLGIGQSEVKARLLYEEYDDEICGELTSDQVGLIVTGLIGIAVHKTPLLVDSSSEQEVLAQYIDTMKMGVTQGKSDILAAVLQGDLKIGKREFVSRFGGFEKGALMTASGLRSWLALKGTAASPKVLS